jgi:hypothetical protein
MRIRIQIRGGRGGGRSAKNLHPPWQNPRYAPEVRDPGWKKCGSGINIADPQHWCNYSLSQNLQENEHPSLWSRYLSKICTRLWYSRQLIVNKCFRGIFAFIRHAKEKGLLAKFITA